jgi:hypothetical protein
MAQKEKLPARVKARREQSTQSSPNEGSKVTTKADTPPDSPPHTEHENPALPPKPDNDAAMDFLLRMYPDGPWGLTAIAPNKKNIQGKRFRRENFSEMKKWVAERNGKLNVYANVNPTMRDFERKASREDIKSVNYLHTDIDARPPNPALSDAEKAKHNEGEQGRILELLTTKLPQGVPPPSIIVFSGGGYQAYWKLKEPIEINGDIAKAEDAKLYNKHLERLFEGDNCHNIDRIMRLPGTINIPDAKKLAKGRKAALAYVVTPHE